MLTGQPYAFVSKVSKKTTYSKNISEFFFCFRYFLFKNTKKRLFTHIVGKKVVTLHSCKEDF